MVFPIVGFFFVSIFGTLSHFLYDWTHHNKISSVLFAVNESTWEHIKMALTPTFIWALIEIPLYYKNPNFIFAILIEVFTIIIIIPIIFYGYQKILKKRIVAIDISSFFIAVLLSQLLFYKITNISPIPNVLSYICLILLLITFASYLLLTLLPLNNKIFKDPLTNKYGVNAHKD